MRGDTGYVVKGHEAAQGANLPTGGSNVRQPEPLRGHSKAEAGASAGCPWCRDRAKREAHADEVAAEIVEVLKSHGLSPAAAFEVLGTAGSYYTLERMSRCT